MAEPKTKPTGAGVAEFLSAIADEQQRADAFRLLALMQEITSEPPKMWGASMVGFGNHHYVYASGHEGDTFLTGFSPRKTALVIYFMAGLEQRFADHLQKLGKVKTSQGCLYVKKLADIDIDVLSEMIRANVNYLAASAKPSAGSAPDKKGRKKQ